MPRAGRTGRARAARTALCATANRSAGPPTRIVVNRASGSSRDVLTPIRRWMSVPMRDRVERRGRRGRSSPGRAPRERRSIVGRSGQRPALGGRQRRARRPRPQRPGRAERPGGGRHRARAGPGSSRMRAAVEQRRGVERLVVDRARPPPPRRAPGVRALVAGGVRVRDDDHRQAERGHLGQRRGAGPPDDQVRGHERLGHLVAQERERPVARARRPRAGPRARRARPRSRSRR